MVKGTCFFLYFCVHDIATTRGQYLDLSKAWRSCYRIKTTQQWRRKAKASRCTARRLQQNNVARLPCEILVLNNVQIEFTAAADLAHMHWKACDGGKWEDTKSIIPPKNRLSALPNSAKYDVVRHHFFHRVFVAKSFERRLFKWLKQTSQSAARNSCSIVNNNNKDNNIVCIRVAP